MNSYVQSKKGNLPGYKVQGPRLNLEMAGTGMWRFSVRVSGLSVLVPVARPNADGRKTKNQNGSADYLGFRNRTIERKS